MMKIWRNCALAACLALLSFKASAIILVTAKVADGYSNCTWRNNGNGTSTLSVTIRYREAAGNLGGQKFWSRGILLYTYDASGNMRPSSAAARYVKINGDFHMTVYKGDGYMMYYGYNPEWKKTDPFTANVEVLITNDQVKDWPGIAIRAGNYTDGNDVGEVTGAAYINMASNSGACTVLDPSKPVPPPPAMVVNMAAPDWNLGDLRRGENEKTLAGASQQLCFTYMGFESYRNFVINATNANGMSGNRYLLKNISKPSQTVPYSVTLDSGSAIFPLPNIGNSEIRLNNNYRTCFVPTFKASVDKSTDGGDYSDVLSFTVVTKT
ncbi:hypothetical protein [Burkholderia sp. SIMBA_062]|uniref:hypothetical protein n=1 Tax=Burkholderia sp. SIMBA_062 TaxID=3085803 RepID=UPI00397E4D62